MKFDKSRKSIFFNFNNTIFSRQLLVIKSKKPDGIESNIKCKYITCTCIIIIIQKTLIIPRVHVNNKNYYLLFVIQCTIFITNFICDIAVAVAPADTEHLLLLLLLLLYLLLLAVCGCLVSVITGRLKLFPSDRPLEVIKPISLYCLLIEFIRYLAIVSLSLLLSSSLMLSFDRSSLIVFSIFSCLHMCC